MKLAGRIALVTGGAGGIGSAICRLFAAEGAGVIVADRDGDAAIALAVRLGGDHAALALDVADPASWQAAAETLSERHDRLDILVNAAGISGFGSIDDIDYEFWSRFQRINTDSIFLSAKTMLPLLRSAPAASIVNIGSTLGLRAHPGLPAYAASKAALRSLTKSLALHFAERGENIRCNAVHPGSTLTPMMEANLSDDPEKRAADIRRRIEVHPLGKALGRIATPEDIARATLFLASNDAAFITGVDLPVDGGATITN